MKPKMDRKTHGRRKRDTSIVKKETAKIMKKKTTDLVDKETVELGAMSVDDFMKTGFEVSDDSEDDASGVDDFMEADFEEPENNEDQHINSVEDSSEGMKKKWFGYEEESDEEALDPEFEIPEEEEEEEDGGESSSSHETEEKKKRKSNDKHEDDEEAGDWTSANFSHKKAVAKLQKTDPEFYKFLQENDKDLLNFDVSDSEAEGDDDEKGGKLHKPPTNLEGDSDESDFEEEGTKPESRTITLKMVEEWATQLPKTSAKSCVTIIDVIHAFHAVVVRVSNDDDASAKYVVTGSSVFNAVVQLCVLDLHPALKKFLRIPSGSHVDPTKNKIPWIKVNKHIRSYVRNLVKLLGGVSSDHILAVMLKHLHQMMPFAACFVVVHRPLLKILVNMWACGEDSVRVIAFLCILRLTTHEQTKILDKALKMMHMSYIRNSKFVSPTTLPAINFMRRSLVEMFALDVNVTYRHAFLYIRQLAIHLRSAITLRKKENFQAVLNWQFINALHFWSDLLGATANKPQLQTLVYPLVQVTTGTIKLIPTSAYFPLRFHCTQILIELSKRTCTFIPVLPFLLEVLNTVNFNIPHKKVSMKPIILTFVLRVPKTQMQENGFKDSVIDTIYRQLLQYLTNESSRIAFPDLIVPAVIQIKKFLKVCKVSNYCRKMKQLLDKIEENAKMVEKERQKVTFKLSEQKSIAAWETQLQLKGTPLAEYYDSWSKMNAVKEIKKVTQNDKLGDFKLPILKKRVGADKPKSDGPVVLFPSDDSDDDMDIMKAEDGEQVKKTRRGGKRAGRSKKLGKSTQNQTEEIDDNDDAGDLVEDLLLEDL